MNAEQLAQRPSLAVRRPEVNLKPGFARHWNGDDIFTTAFFNALSMSFPAGEKFFIQSVRAGTCRLDDHSDNRGLRETAHGFVGQESMHRHLHSAFNRHLEQQGLVNKWGPRIEWEIALLRRAIAACRGDLVLHELAITAAYEHFTALLGELALMRIDQPGDWLADAHEPVKTLWRWHAAEEAEHKAVAFDLHTHLGGKNSWRIFWFLLVSMLLLTDVSRQTVNNLWHDRTIFRPRTWYGAMRFLVGRYGVVRATIPAFVAYLRHDFHPDQRDSATLARAWLDSNAARWKPVHGPAENDSSVPI